MPEFNAHEDERAARARRASSRRTSRPRSRASSAWRELADDDIPTYPAYGDLIAEVDADVDYCPRRSAAG